MLPFVRNGDCLVIKPEKAGGVKIGDIILYRYPWGNYVVHRLIKKNGQATLLTRGDNLFYFDRPVPNECVLGKVTRIERAGKQIQLTTGPGQIFGFLMACFARGHYPNQVGLVRNLGRLYWLIGGKRTT
jgi:signal peptidase I